MRVPYSRAELTPRDVVLIAAFAAVTLATTVVFAQAITGHVAAKHAASADVVITDYEVTDDRLELTVRFHNPAIRDVDLHVAQVNAYVDGEMVSDGTVSRLDEVTIPSEETRTVTLPIDLREGGAERLRNADPDRIEVRGLLKVLVVDETVHVRVDGTEVSG